MPDKFSNLTKKERERQYKKQQRTLSKMSPEQRKNFENFITGMGGTILTPPGEFGGGRSGGAGSSFTWDSVPVTDRQDKIQYIPLVTQRSFSDAFADARRQGLPDFMFNGKRYTTEMSDNPKYTKAEYENYPTGTLRTVKNSQGKIYPDSTMVLPNPMIYGEFKRDENPNIFDNGGWKDNWKGDNIGNSILGVAGSLAPGITSIIEGANTDTSNIDNAVNADIKALRNGWSGVNDDSLDSLMNQQVSFRNMDTEYNAADKFNVPTSGSVWRDSLSGAASSAASVAGLGPWAAAGSFLFNLGSGLFGGFSKKKKIQEAVNNADAKYAAAVNKENAYRQNSIRNAMENKVANNDRMLFSQVAAYGGPLGISLIPVNSAIDYMQNEELMSRIGEDMTKNNNKRMAMPEFAFGGALQSNGSDWTNGLTFINAGGRHEQNPLGGVPMGIAEDGNPNVVEEGEVVHGDYVFSDRLVVPNDTYEVLGLKKGKEHMTFADAAKKLQKYASERPNDPIAQRGLDAAMAKLTEVQEKVRAEKAQQDAYNEAEDMAAYAADGGPIHIAKNKRGTFTAAASKHGMGVQEFASKVLANKEDYSPAMVKKANFARNASKWHHALGGHLFWPGGPKGKLVTPITDWANSDYYLGNSPMDAYVPVHTDYSKPWDVWDTQTYFGQDPLVITPKASRSESTIQPKPYAQSPIKQNPTPIYLSDDSEMNRYIAATNPLVMYNSAISDTLGFKYNGLGTTYNTASTTGTTNTTNANNTNDKGQRDLLPTSGWQTGLRYLPAIAPAISLGYSLFKKPDYGYADDLAAAGDAYAELVRGNGKVTPKFIGDYLSYTPFDRLFYANELGAQQAATNRAIMNQSSGNRSTAMAGLLASGYNSNVGLGKLFREGEEYNRAQRERVANFNRGTNQYNSTLDMQAQEINANKNERLAAALLENKYKELAMRQAIDDQRGHNISVALTDLFNNIGGIGEDFVNRYDRNALINADIFGTLSQKPYGVSDADWENYVNAHNKIFSACGGKISRKKKKGLTI